MSRVDTLRADQLKAYQTIMEFLSTKSGGIVLLQGNAGTGKTHLVGVLLYMIAQSNRGLLLALAPTNDAVKVLKRKAGFSSAYVKYTTIHAAYNMKPVKDSAELKFKQDLSRPVLAEQARVIFVDEVSQMDDDLFYMLNRDAESGKKIILIGDDCQIPPINYDYSIPFIKKEQKRFGIQVVELKEPIRQNVGSPILDNGVYIRSKRKYSRIYMDRLDVINSVGEEVRFIEGDEYEVIDGLLEELFLTPNFNSDNHYAKVFCWRNKTVDMYNRKIRRMLYGALSENWSNDRTKEIKKLVIGERLLSNAPVIEREGDTEKMVFSTNEELKVLSYVVDNMEVGDFNLKYYDTVVSYVNDVGVDCTYSIMIVHEDSEKLHTRILKDLGDYAKSSIKPIERMKAWKEYWGFVEMFASVSYDYAKTTHRAQGGTYENAIVDESDIVANTDVDERNRIFYTACTRPTKKCYIIYKD